MTNFLTWIDRHILRCKVSWFHERVWQMHLERVPNFEFALDQLERQLATYGQVADVELWRSRKIPNLWYCHFNVLYGDTVEDHEHKFFEGEGTIPGKALQEAIYEFVKYTDSTGQQPFRFPPKVT